MNSEEITKNADLQRVVTEGGKIYQEIKARYEPAQNGKFLAMDIDSKKAYIADTSAEAVVMAREHHPNKVFYVVKIGFDAAETMARLSSKK
jgi:hypothetical protein